MIDTTMGIQTRKVAKEDDPSVGMFNEYQEALYLCMSVLEQFDNDQHIPFLGFGAKLPPSYSNSSACFAMNGNIFMPEEKGITSLMEAYMDGFPKL